MPGEAFDEDENDNALFTELDLKFKFQKALNGSAWDSLNRMDSGKQK